LSPLQASCRLSGSSRGTFGHVQQPLHGTCSSSKDRERLVSVGDDKTSQ
jgi:hypothetical protein